MSQHFLLNCYQSFLDLSIIEATDRPLFVEKLNREIKAWKNESEELPLHVSITASFRENLYKSIYYTPVAIDTPLDIPYSERSEDWKILCNQVSNFQQLDVEEKVSLVRLLKALGFLQLIQRLFISIPEHEYSDHPKFQELQFLVSQVRYILSTENQSPYQISEVEDLVDKLPPNSILKADALYQVVVQYAKVEFNGEKIKHYLPQLQSCIENGKEFRNEAHYYEYLSRFYRVGAFLPMIENKQAEVVAFMDKAQELALKIPCENDEDAIFRASVLFPVLESRIKENYWLKSPQNALQYALELTKLSPKDAMVLVELAESYLELERIEEAKACYLNALEYAVTGRAMIYYLLGYCYEHLVQYQEAMYAYQQSYRIDYEALSAVEGIERIAHLVGNDALVSEMKNVKNQLGEIEISEKAYQQK